MGVSLGSVLTTVQRFAMTLFQPLARWGVLACMLRDRRVQGLRKQPLTPMVFKTFHDAGVRIS